MKTQTFIIVTLTVLFNVMALQGFSADKQAPETDHKALSFLPEMSNLVLEEKLELAPWMFSDLQWQKEPEERMEIAPWMTNDQAWKLKEKQMVVHEPVNLEEQLAIESWMTDDQLWHL